MRQILIQDVNNINFLIPENKIAEWLEIWRKTELKPIWAKEIYEEKQDKECVCFIDYGEI